MLAGIGISHAQTQLGAVNGYCTGGATNAVTSGLSSSNKLQAVVPKCTVTVYYTGSSILIPIYTSTGAPLSNSFTANTDGSWLFYIPQNVGVDIVLSGGGPPNSYATAKVYTDVVAPGTGTVHTVPAYVHGTSCNGSSTGSITTATVTLTCPSNSYGDALLLSIYSSQSLNAFNSISFTVSDTQGNVWTLVNHDYGRGFVTSAAVFIAVPIVGGSDMITVTETVGNGAGPIAMLYAQANEFTGVNANFPVVQSALNVVSSGGTSAGYLLPSTQSGDLLYEVSLLAGNAAPVTFSATGYTALSAICPVQGSALMCAGTLYAVSNAATPSLWGPTVNWTADVIGFAENFLIEFAGSTNPTPSINSSGGAMTLISDQLLNAPAATVSFSSISSGYKQLVVYATAACSAAGSNDQLYLQVNGDSAAHYGYEYLLANGGSTFAGDGGASMVALPKLGDLGCANVSNNGGTSYMVTLPDYAGTTFAKNAITTANVPVGSSFGTNYLSIENWSWWWNSTAAINQLTFGVVGGSNFVTGSRFTLYGIN
jgi:hypothetical protein